MSADLEVGRRTTGALAAVATTLALIALAAAVVLRFGDDGGAPTEAVAGPAEVRLQPVRQRPDGDPPHRLVVPSLDIRAPLDPIEVTPEGVLTPPDDGDVVGWWQRSAHPGSRQGQTVVTGHTFQSGPAAMNRLGTVDKGAVVRVHDDGVVVSYRVRRTVKYSVAEVAERAYDLFAQDRGDGRLVMVTCTDYVDGDYQSNVIVFAEPVGQKRGRSSDRV